MRKGNDALRPSETSLIIQAQIEGLTPRQILERDKLVKDGLSHDLATKFTETWGRTVDYTGIVQDLNAWFTDNNVSPSISKIILERVTDGIVEFTADELVESDLV